MLIDIYDILYFLNFNAQSNLCWKNKIILLKFQFSDKISDYGQVENF